MPERREQYWARMAFEKVSSVGTQPWAEDYGRQAKHLPALIHQCGVCQALTFLQAKGAAAGGAAKRQLLKDLASALQFSSADALIAEARDSATTSYHLLTRNALGCAVWFKRYAEALLRIDEPSEDEETS
ncbi:MAG: type III-B CRISPR module-associated protein Cmr5 [Armatimonadota bacterium]